MSFLENVVFTLLFLYQLIKVASILLNNFYTKKKIYYGEIFTLFYAILHFLCIFMQVYTFFTLLHFFTLF